MRKIGLKTTELKEGMVVAKDVHNRELEIILQEGVKLTDQLIDRLNFLYEGIEVIVYQESVEEVDDVELMNIKRFEDAEKILHQYTEEIENVFEDLEKNGHKTISQLKDISVQMMEKSSDFKSIFDNIMTSINKDKYLYRHSANVSLLASMLGKWMGYDEEEIRNLATAGMLIDIGKTQVDQAILNKNGKLTDWEFQEIKKHSSLGYEMLSEIEGINDDIKIGILMHHEKEDGSGYPYGLTGDRIHRYAKILAIVDIFDAMTSDRVYSLMTSPFKVLEMFQKDSFGKLDPNCIFIFLKNICTYYEGEDVLLNTGEVAKIIRMNQKEISRPLIQVKDRFVDMTREKSLEIIKMA